jgi:DNA-directed RNA polymerase specialized sigma24 family protein
VSREVVALVSADDAVAAIRVHADRVHDLLRRSGCGPEESVEVTEAYAFALLDALVNAPQTVGDMAGWWFGRALELARRLGGTAEASDVRPHEESTSVLAGTPGEAQVRAALASLPESERTAVLLRDGYDLPPQAVAVALRRDAETTDALVAVGRLHLGAAYDDRTPPDLSGHTGRTPADLAALSRLADGTLVPQRSVGLRRHLSACVACEDTVDALARGRRLAAGLPVIAMPDDAREGMLERVGIRAAATLPTVDEVLLAVEEDDDIRPAISPLIVVFAVVVALVLGVAVAALTRSNSSGGESDTLTPLPSVAPVVTPAFPTTSVTPSASASGSRSPSARPSTTATASVRPTSTGSVFVVNPAIVLSPPQGPRGTQITVTGTGWEPGDSVTLRYVGTVTSSSSTAVASARGAFRVVIAANGLVPGDYTVRATGSSGSASASFTQTS